MSKVVVNTDLGRHLISRHLYGHFSEHLGRCIYGGLWVGEKSPIPNTRGIRNDIVEALRAISIPNLRWPGGCFADEYHWQDGIGPRGKRPCMVNTHWGGVTENNHFGTHEFLDLCDQLECEPYICGNLGSGTVREMSQWVEYLTMAGQSPMSDLRREHGRDQPWRVKYWGVGNENWSCGGSMRPEYYLDEFRRYATYCRNHGDNRLYKVACGPNGADYRWTEVLMKDRGRHLDGLALHFYCGSGKSSQSATEYEEADWFALLHRSLFLDELLTKHTAIMDKYDPDHAVGLLLDEWGTWHQVEPGTNPGFLFQQNTLRDALVAGVSLNILNAHCERVSMANIAQTVNVLQAMILTEGEKMLLTPTYHVFDMYQVHHDATLLPIDLACDAYRCGDETVPSVSASASRDAANRIHLTLCNLDPNNTVNLSCEFRGVAPAEVRGHILTGSSITCHNSFDQPDCVKPVQFAGAKLNERTLDIALPPKSVVSLEVV